MVSKRLELGTILEDDPEALDRLDWYEKDPKTGCWVWQGTTTKGCPKIKILGQSFSVPRLMWLISTGEDPGRMDVGRSCGNLGCVRPDHLELRRHGISKPLAQLQRRG
jgi:hypothetical protein